MLKGLFVLTILWVVSRFWRLPPAVVRLNSVIEQRFFVHNVHSDVRLSKRSESLSGDTRVASGALGMSVLETTQATTLWGKLYLSIRREKSGDSSVNMAVRVDLLAACLRSGLSIGQAAAAVGEQTSGSFGAALREAAVLLELGARPDHAWATTAKDPVSAPLAKAITESLNTGTSLEGRLEYCADEMRRAQLATMHASAERAGVIMAGPLGLCFLPAFICLGLVPVVVGVGSQMFSGVP